MLFLISVIIHHWFLFILMIFITVKKNLAIMIGFINFQNLHLLCFQPFKCEDFVLFFDLDFLSDKTSNFGGHQLGFCEMTYWPIYQHFIAKIISGLTDNENKLNRNNEIRV